MGKALIVSNLGEGLYTAKMLYNLDKIKAERTRLLAEHESAAQKLRDAWVTYYTLRRDAVTAEAALNALIEQWKQNLLTALKRPDPPEPPTPLNPETGAPWTEDELNRERADRLAEAINAVRAARSLAPFVRDPWLDEIAQDTIDKLIEAGEMTGLLDSQHVKDRMSQFPGEGAFMTAAEILGFGYEDATAQVEKWLASDPTIAAELLTPGLPEGAPEGAQLAIGTGAGYGLQHPAAYAYNEVMAILYGEGGGGGPGTARWAANTEYGIRNSALGPTDPITKKAKVLMVMNGYSDMKSGDTEPVWGAVGSQTSDHHLRWAVLAYVDIE